MRPQNERQSLEVRADSWYLIFVNKKALIETNPYLKDPKKRHEGLVSFVFSSTAIETPNVPRKTIRRLFIPKVSKAHLTRGNAKSSK